MTKPGESILLPSIPNVVHHIDDRITDDHLRTDATPESTGEWGGDIEYIWIGLPGVMVVDESLFVPIPITGQVVSAAFVWSGIGDDDCTVVLNKNGSSTSNSWTFTAADTSASTIYLPIINPRVPVTADQDFLSVDITADGYTASYWYDMTVRFGIGTVAPTSESQLT